MLPVVFIRRKSCLAEKGVYFSVYLVGSVVHRLNMQLLYESAARRRRLDGGDTEFKHKGKMFYSSVMLRLDPAE